MHMKTAMSVCLCLTNCLSDLASIYPLSVLQAIVKLNCNQVTVATLQDKVTIRVGCCG